MLCGDTTEVTEETVFNTEERSEQRETHGERRAAVDQRPVASPAVAGERVERIADRRTRI